MTNTFASSALAWLLTYAVHSTVLLGMAWLVLRLRRAEPATADVLWKVAMIGALLTASAQTALQIRPAGSVSLQRAPVASTAAFDAPSQMANDALVTPSGASTPEITSNAAAAPTTGSLPVTREWNTSTAALLAGSWAIIALALVVWYAGRRLILVGRLGDRRVIHDGELATLLSDLRREAGVSRKIILTASQSISSPVALGRNEICLPVAATSELDPAQQRAMLAHELAHLMRRDPQWLVFACLMERAFFFQPLNRLARRGMQQSAEYLADEWAAARSGGVPLARCLVKVAEWIQASPLGVPVAGMAEERSHLAARVTRLIEESASGPTRSRRSLAFLSSGVLVAVVMFAPGVAGRAVSPEVSASDLLGLNSATEAGVSFEENTERDTPVEPTTRRAKDSDPTTDHPVEQDIKLDTPTSMTRGDKGTVAREDTAVVRALMARLRDEDAQVRRAAAHALGRIGNPIAINALVAALDDSEIEVQNAALDALSDFDRGVPAAPIRKMLLSPNADVRHTALHVLGDMRDRESATTIARLVRDADADVRQTALQALAEIKDPSFASAMIGALNDEDADVREAALQALTEVGGAVPEEAVRRALRDIDADVRDAAIHVVEERRMVAMVPELIQMLDDTSAEIRECAADALTEMRTEQSHAALKAALTHRDPEVRKVAVEYFGQRDDS